MACLPKPQSLRDVELKIWRLLWRVSRDAELDIQQEIKQELEAIAPLIATLPRTESSWFQSKYSISCLVLD